MKIAVIGTGYVGLVAGTCFAETGNNVICVDTDNQKIEDLKQGKIPIYEPGLKELVIRNMKENRLIFTTSHKEAVENSSVIFIAVGTPSSDDGSADLSIVLTVAKSIAQNMNEYKIIVNKSTVPVGTADKVGQIIGKFSAYQADIVSNPEFLKEGAAVDDFLKPDRVVIGANSIKAFEILDQLYAPFVRQGNPIIHMNNHSAELTKYASNCFLATKISFINEIANLCETLGADISDVKKGICADRRIGKQFLYPGLGYGGSCFPKDVRALIKISNDHKFDLNIVKAVEIVNNKQRLLFVEKIKKHFQGNLNGKKFFIWGLSFKPNTDDLRQAPSVDIIDKLLEAGAQVHAYDPIAMPNYHKFYGDRKVHLEDRMYGGMKDSDALCLLTEWNEFRNPDFNKILSELRKPIIFDGRNIFNPTILTKMGFTYYGIGTL